MMSRQSVSALDTFGLKGTLDGDPDGHRNGGGHHHESVDEEGTNDHLASIYEGKEDQFKSVVPFIKYGLKQGEQCLYIADDNSEEEIREILREGGVDVQAAMESGALSIHTKADTYLRSGGFEQEEMLDFWRETLFEAQEQKGFSGVRAAAEMTWALDEDLGLDRLVEYEAMLNTIYPGEDYVVLCQYNRNRFPEEVLSEVIQSHPLVVYDGTVCSNVQYRRPKEFFGTDRPVLDVDRTVEELVRRARTQQSLRERDRYQREFYRITSNPNRSFQEKLDALFELGCEYFDLELGGLARVDPALDRFEVEALSEEHEHLAPGQSYPLSETYCRLTADQEAVTGISNPVDSGFEGTLCYDSFGVQAYLGTHLHIDGDLDRTFFFVSFDLRDRPFTDNERTFHHLMGQWVESEIQRQQREEHLAGLNTLSREILQAKTKQHICEIVVEAAESRLSMPIAAIALYEPETQTLQLSAATERATEIIEPTSVLDANKGGAWRAFANRDPSHQDVPVGGVTTSASACRLHILPLGRHGVFLTGSIPPPDEPSSTCDVVETIASHTEAALDRAHREQLLHEREKSLTQLNNTLEKRVEERTRQVRELTSRITMAEQREQRRIARVLHDDLQQRLYGIQLKMRALRNGESSAEKAQIWQEIEEMEEQIEALICTTRQLSVGMSPPVLRSEGLTAAFEWLQSHMKKTRGLEVDLSAEGEFPMGEDLRVLLFQVTREILVNVAENVGGDCAEIVLVEKEAGLSIRIRVEGHGADSDTLKGLETDAPFDLAATRERINLFGGEVSVRSLPHEGAEVVLQMPFENATDCGSVRARDGGTT